MLVKIRGVLQKWRTHWTIWSLCMIDWYVCLLCLLNPHRFFSCYPDCDSTNSKCLLLVLCILLYVIWKIIHQSIKPTGRWKTNHWLIDWFINSFSINCCCWCWRWYYYYCGECTSIQHVDRRNGIVWKFYFSTRVAPPGLQETPN